MSAVRRLLAVAAGLLLLGPATGCVNMPESGPVVEAEASSGAPDTSGVKYDPLPPLPDASRSEIVKGFLDAMTAVPIQTTSAAEFLTEEARLGWRPETETVTYGDRSAAIDDGSSVTVRMLDGADHFDDRGAWLGSLSGDDLELRFGLVLEEGEYRISEVPDALVVPESWFEARYRRLSLQFFDASARILVPEPVFVANDDALATRLVEGLLDGPPGDLGRSSRSFFPPGTSLDLSVPVAADGVADVALRQVGRQSPESQRLMVIQLVTTLRQVDAISSVRVSVDGQPVQLPEADDGRISVDLGSEYDAAAPDASAIVFGLRGGALVGGIPEALDAVAGPLGTGATPLAAAGVSLDGSTAAGVSEDRTSVLVAPVNGETTQVRSILDRGTDLLRPSWDFAQRIWLVDRRADGARVRYFEDGRLRGLDVPGVTGERVRSFVVSRDGSRLVAVVADVAGDRLVVSRVLHGAQGQVREAAPARTILDGTAQGQSIKDVSWQTPTSVAVLIGVTGELWEVRSVAVDGAPTSVESIANLNGPVRSLAGSPVPGQGLLVLAPDEVLDLSGPVAERIRFAEGQRPESLDYVG
jgi:hypothetical protein